jgi:ubiquinone biosynthesis monooxygenase Coq7
MRDYNIVDTFIVECDKAIRTVLDKPKVTSRPTPSHDTEQPILSATQRQQAIRLMRVNHAGEVSAQALYQGQALTAKSQSVRQAMAQSAIEENDHLVWCEQRVTELGGHTSILNPFWYAGSYVLGAVAGQIGDKWSLGFVAETEAQVVKHIDEHLEKLGQNDSKSRAILEQMKIDEAHHGTVAIEAGGIELPTPIKFTMSLISKVMTASSYRI